MATEAQIAANRANAQLSTGPRTPQGKALVARNALKHGLTASADTLLPNEDPEHKALCKYRNAACENAKTNPIPNATTPTPPTLPI